MKKNRATLKEYFRKGAIPSESNFADLIDSMLNQEEDAISKLPNDPLRVTAVGEDEALLNFYRVEQNQEKLTWQLKQKSSGKTGLSFQDDGVTRLFIENSTGRIGVGTSAPAAKLDVGGNVNIGDALTVKGPLTVGSVQISGFTAAEADEWSNFSWCRDSAANWDEGLIKHGPSRGKFSRSGFGIHFHQSREFGFFSTGWDPLFAVAGKSGDAFLKGALEVGGALKIKGNAVTSGSVYAGGNPLAYENFEIYLRGSAFESPEGNNTYLKIANVDMGMDARRGLNTVVLKPNGAFKGKANHDVYGNSNSWNDWADWVNSTASNGDIVATASYDALRNAPLGGFADTLLTGIAATEAFSAEKGNQRSPYVLIFVKGKKAVEVSMSYKGPNAHLKTTYYALLNNTVREDDFVRRSTFHHRMYPDNPRVYQDIFDAKSQGAITKFGNPPYDETSYNPNLWHERRIIKFGGNDNADGNGALVTIPPGYDTVWVRVLGERWTVVKADFVDGDKKALGLWAGGYRAMNCYCPDGSLSDGAYVASNDRANTAHQWVPIPAGRSGQLALVAKPNTENEFWISGLAFSRNPWGHAGQSAVAYHWASNGGDTVKWNSIWKNDALAELTAKSNYKLIVPVIPNGRDKLLYLIEHNSDWNGAHHNGIKVNGNPIERFLSTYDNPFARHWNSKFYERYLAARIPANSIPADRRWLEVNIDMGKQTNSLYFREIGTHDMDTPAG